jgi:hypothetical protein
MLYLAVGFFVGLQIGAILGVLLAVLIQKEVGAGDVKYGAADIEIGDLEK